MRVKQQFVTVEVQTAAYENDPARWDWPTLTDMPDWQPAVGGDQIRVIMASEPKIIEVPDDESE